MSFGFGAFLDGVVGGMERRRRWDNEDLTTQWAREDRDIAREDRERRIRIEDEEIAYTRSERDHIRRQRELDQEARTAVADAVTGGGGSGGGSGDDRAPAVPQAPRTPQVGNGGEAPTAPSAPTAPQMPSLGSTEMPRPEPRPVTEIPDNTAAEDRAERVFTSDSGPGRTIQPGDQPPAQRTAPAQPAVPGSVPEAPAPDSASTTPQQGYGDALRAAGITDPAMIQAAEGADLARRGLSEGIHPRTGAPLQPQERQQLQQIVAQADQALAATLAERDTGRGVPAPPATQGASPEPPTMVTDPNGAPVAMRPPRADAPQGRQIEMPQGAPGLNNAPVQNAIATGDTQPVMPGREEGRPVGSTQPPAMPAQPQAPGSPPRQITQPGERLRPDAPAPSVEEVVNPNSPEEQREAQQGAAQAATELPSSQAAQETAAQTAREIQVDGETTLTVGNVSEEALARAGQNFVAAYNNEAVDRALQALARAGDFEGMQQFQQFIEDEETQRAMEHFGRAVMAAQLGDADQFVIEMAAVYNTEKYYDDGYNIDLEQTEVFRNEDGSFAGVNLAFVNEESGEVSMMEVMDEDDFYSIAIGMGAPETVFAQGREQYLAELQERAAEEEGFDIEAVREDAQSIYDAMMEAESENFANMGEDGPPEGSFLALSERERWQRVMEIIREREAAIGGVMFGGGPPAGGATSGPVPVATQP